MGLALDIATNDEWHVLKGETHYGPYSYEEMLRLFQQNLIYGFDYAWGPHLDSWTPLADLAEFSPERISRLAEKNRDVFNKRSHERVLCKLPVYINDQQTMWDGTVENLSEGGALVLMKNPVLLPGNIVHLHFRSRTDKDVAFNCTAEILTKRLVKHRIQHDTGIHYAVRFLNKTVAGEKQLKDYIKEFKTEKNVNT